MRHRAPKPLAAGRRAGTRKGTVQRERVSVRQEGNGALVETTVFTAVRKDEKDKPGLGEELRDRPRSYSQSPGATSGAPTLSPVLVFLPENHFSSEQLYHGMQQTK